MSDNALSINEALAFAVEALKCAEITNPKLNAELLLCNALSIDKTHLYLEDSRQLDVHIQKKFIQMVERRAHKEPIQYITGDAGFMGKEFYVEPGVLIPRPETEVMVEACLSYLLSRSHSQKKLNILDLCTGSGCIAISIAEELKHQGINSNILATDISNKALQVAKINAKNHDVLNSVKFLKGDLLEPVEKTHPQLIGNFDLIISNPPYVPSSVYENLPYEVKNYEPKIALDAGIDGMKFFYKIADFAADALCPGAMLAIELHETKVHTAAQYLKTLKYKHIQSHNDLADKPRFITAIAG